MSAFELVLLAHAHHHRQGVRERLARTSAVLRNHIFALPDEVERLVLDGEEMGDSSFV
jgi:hypothetical protein